MPVLDSWRARNRLVFENEVTSYQRIKANLFPICGLGLTCIVLITRILFWTSSLGWRVGRVFGFVSCMVCSLSFTTCVLLGAFSIFIISAFY